MTVKNWLLLCLVLWSVSFYFLEKANAAGNSYYLSTTGSNSNSGTSTGSAWATLNYACQQLHAGDILYVMPGTYTDDTSGSQRGVMVSSGTEGNPIIIMAYDSGNKPRFAGISDAQGRWQGTGITIANKSYVEIRNLSITGYYINIDISSSYQIRIDSCEIFGNGTDSETNVTHQQVLRLAKNSNVVITNNKIHTICNGNNLINLSGDRDNPTHNITISNNEIYDVSKHNAINIMNTINIATNTFQRNIYNITITGNRIHDVDKGVINCGSAPMVTNSSSIQDSYVADNIVYDSGRGILLTAVNTTFYNNTVYNIATVAPLGSHQALGTMINCLYDSNDADIVFVGGVENTVVHNPLKSIREYGGTGFTIRDINVSTITYWSVNEANATIEDTRSKILRAVKVSGIAPCSISTLEYHPGRSSMSICTTDNAATSFTITAYPAYAVPIDGYLTITPNAIDRTTDIWDFTVASSVSENPTTFTLETLNPNTVYTVKRDNAQIATAYTDNTGKLIYSYTVTGNEYSTSHNFYFVSTGQPAPDTYALTITSGAGSGFYSLGTMVNISANAASSGKMFDKWTGDTGSVADVYAAATTVTVPASPVSLTAMYKDITATTYTLTAPSPASGAVNRVSGNFTVAPNGKYTGTITVTPSGGGLSTPVTLIFSYSAAAQTFVITPADAGTITLTPSNSGGLTDPSQVIYAVYGTGTLRNASWNYPNPVNFTKTEHTTIAYTVADECKVYICLYSLAGELVKVLVNEKSQAPGKYYIDWYGDNDGGASVASGVYLYIAKIGKDTIKKKIVLVR